MINTIIIGSGPSGLMCANELQKHQREYIILEKNSELGKKLLITGGSRCNVTNILDSKDFINALTFKNNRFLYSAISNFSPKDVVNFFEDKGLKLELTDNFFYFPSTQKSKDVLDCLTKDLDKENIFLNEEVESIKKEQSFYEVKTSKRVLTAKNIVISTGSKAYPKTGSTGDGIKFAKSLKIESVPFYPAESSVKSNFIAKNKDIFQGITLINKTVKIVGDKISFNGNILFTHFGLSGPAILQISEFVYHKLRDNEEVYLTFNLSEFSVEEYLNIQQKFIKSQKTLKSFVESLVYKRLAIFILKSLNLDFTKKVRETSKKDLNLIMNSIINFKVKINDTLSISTSFVNGGGVSLKELSSTTFETKKYPGLFFVGEVIDAHGPIGGFNITIAFASGISAARAIIKK